MARASLPASRRATSRSPGKRLTEARATMMPVMATTTSTSMRVKPLVPVPDVGRIAVAAARLVGAQAEDIDLALHARGEILVVAAPRIARQALEVAALLPVARRRRRGGAGDQRPQSLLGGRVEAVVETVELERLDDGHHVGLGGDALGLVGAVHDAGHD